MKYLVCKIEERALRYLTQERGKINEKKRFELIYYELRFKFRLS